jgi:hypothetical protein
MPRARADSPALPHHDVRWLQVAVDDALLVRGGEGLGERGPDRHQPLERHPALGDEPVEELALHHLHGQEVDASRILDGVDGDDARMVEGGERLRPRAGSARAPPGSRPSRAAAP